ncbi:MAG: glucose-6-phosphate isomerase, partial [Burkholderiaceae bacterium]
MTDSTLRGTAAYRALAAHFEATRDLDMRALFAADPGRFPALTVEAAGLFLDFSKNRLTRQALDLLCALARERGVEARRDAMFAGEIINTTERRAVLHTALRSPDPAGASVDGRDVGAEVHAVLARMRDFAERVRSGAWHGHTGRKITDVVNIGIGGSDLGPKMACRALRPYAAPDVAMHFVSNVDGHDIDACLSRLSPETTLFIIASKTFTTQETMMNADTARRWFLRSGTEADLARHFVAVSTNTDAVTRFGIDPANMFPFWDWVGGRYSVWSAIGLSLTVAIGAARFDEFLAGARAMDEHFRSAPLERNMPALLALIGIWYRNFFGAASHTIAPYHQDLNRFPAYRQQLDMESNGKRVTRAGDTITDYATGPVIWGDVGTNGQHAYFQLLHQGTALIPVDFIAALEPAHEMPQHHVALLANCFAQSEALMRGKTVDEV